MKKYLSVFTLSARRTLPRLLIILIVASAAQIALFYMTLQSSGGPYTADTMPLLQDVISGSHMAWVMGAAFLLYMAVLCSVLGKKASGQTAYTTHRLPISEPAFYWIQALYNCCALLIFLGAEIASVMVMACLYDAQVHLAGASQHLVFLGFYQSGVLHSLLPLADVWTHIENLFIFLSLGISAARFSKKQSRGSADGAAPIAVIITALAFCSSSGGVGAMMHIALIFVLIAGIVSAYTISKGGTLDEEEINAAPPADAAGSLPAEN